MLSFYKKKKNIFLKMLSFFCFVPIITPLYLVFNLIYIFKKYYILWLIIVTIYSLSQI